MEFWLFLHLLGFTMWLRGFASMVAGIAAKREDRQGWGGRAVAGGAQACSSRRARWR
jgi:hypothetical protein